MKETRIFPFLSSIVFCLFLLVLGFNAWVRTDEMLRFIKTREIPAVGLAISTRIENIISKYTRLENDLLADNFIRGWLQQGENKEKTAAVSLFLEKLRSRYDFLEMNIVSSATEKYYGTDKVYQLSQENWEQDGWFYEFRDNAVTSSIYSRYYENTFAMYINVPIFSEDGVFLGVAGGGFYSNEINAILKHFERDWAVNIFLFRNDGELVYSTSYDYYQGPRTNLNEQWGIPLLDKMQRWKESPSGMSLQSSFDSDAVLWGTYLKDWDSYLVIERPGLSVKREIRDKTLQSVIIEFFFMLIIFILFLFFSRTLSKRLEDSTRRTQAVIERFQAVIDGQFRLLQSAEHWLSAFAGHLLKKETSEPFGQDAITQCAYLQESRQAVKAVLSADSIDEKLSDIPLQSVLQNVLLRRMSDFSRSRITVHTKFPAGELLVLSNASLLYLVFDDMMCRMYESAAAGSQVFITAGLTGSSPYTDFVVSGEFCDENSEKFHFARSILTMMYASLEFLPGENNGGIYRVVFSGSGTNI